MHTHNKHESSRQRTFHLLLYFIVILLASASLTPALSDEERPVNFIFLIDVSGSMLYKSTMVTARDGSQVTLFEALRQALVQIAQDPRLINSHSKISYITFGTKVTEKSDWPSQLNTEQDRQALTKVLLSEESLNADKHGDTYMGGALQMALDKAKQIYSEKEPCTTTFIVMMTDGWDEPPAGATLKVRTVAGELAAKQKELLNKLGVKTWNVLVIGLQRLPEKKAGTTTAKELADILAGDFIDVSKSSGGTVSERIFLALKNQVEQLKGQLTLGKGSSIRNGTIDFGAVNGNGGSRAQLPLELNSCYPEEINGISEIANSIPSRKLDEARHKVLGITPGAWASVSTLPVNAISVSLVQKPYVVSPGNNSDGKRNSTGEQIELFAQAHNNCPAGQFFGCLKLDSSAKVPEFIPWMIRVPGRLVADPEELKVKVRKPGFFWPESTSVELIGRMKELPGSHAMATYAVTISPGSAVMHGHDAKVNDGVEANLPASLINSGRPIEFQIDTSKKPEGEFKFPIEIPANQKPGEYRGVLSVQVSGPTETVAPSELPFSVLVQASAWEEIAPIAVPMIILLLLTTCFGLFLWGTNQRRD